MKAISYGEVLWDISDNSSTLGGAPLNVLGHIARLKDDGIIISAIGNDELGGETKKALLDLGIDTTCLEVKDGIETGKAYIKLDNGIPSYSFNDPAAWDLIDGPGSSFFDSSYDVFIFGTLCQRSKKSRETLYRILDNLKCREVFFDVNLRLNFYSNDIICKSLGYATILKMNDEELPIVLMASGCKDIQILKQKYDLKIVILTKGKKGTELYYENKIYTADPENVKVVDTVGAGDSLSGSFLHFYLNGDDIECAIKKASMVADYVVTKNGAIPEYSEEILSKIL